MKQVKMNMIETEGYAVTVEIEGDLKDYMENFLHIFNNVRANKELLKIKNYYDSNEVTVYCELDAKDALVKYLNKFGRIASCEKILAYTMEEPEYDFDKYYDVIINPKFD